MVVDDDSAVHDDLRRYIPLDRYEIISITEADKALGDFLDRRPDIVIMDYDLGRTTKLNGVMLAKQFRASGWRFALIMMTQRWDEEVLNSEIYPESFFPHSFNFERIGAKLWEAEKNFEARFQNEKKIKIKSNIGYVLVRPSDLIYVTGRKEGGILIKIEEMDILENPSMQIKEFVSQYEQRLVNHLRVHRSFYVNVEKIKSWEPNGNSIQILFDYKVPVPKSGVYREEGTCLKFKVGKDYLANLIAAFKRLEKF